MAVVTINGTRYSVYAATLSFDDVARLAGFEGHPSITVRVKGSEGSVLTPGGYVTPVDGQVFNVADTGNA